MEVDALRWFQLIADGATMTEVAYTEQITQPGISRALDRLEAEVGTPLLTRSGRILRVTHAGSIFKRHVDVLLHELDDGLAAVNELVDPESGTVTLAFHLSLSTWLVPDLVSTFRAKHPHVQFELKPLRDEPLASGTRQPWIDLEITTLRPRDSSARWRSLLIEPLWLAVSPDHAFASYTQMPLAEAAAEPFIMLRATSVLRHLCDDLCAGAGFEPIVAFEGDDLPTVRGFVAAGLGVAIVPALREGSPDGSTGPLHYVTLTDVGAHREIGLSWSSSRRLLPTAELFRRHVLERAASQSLPPVVG